MSNQVGNGRPQHFCAWSKEKLGWVKPAVIDPTVKQKLILAPIEDSPKECFKVLLRRDGCEYLLLENRQKKGFDQGLPADGLLIWHVVGNRPILEESHGVEGPSGPRVFLNAVPYPSPRMTPSRRTRRRRAGRSSAGRRSTSPTSAACPTAAITFQIGYEYE